MCHQLHKKKALSTQYIRFWHYKRRHLDKYLKLQHDDIKNAQFSVLFEEKVMKFGYVNPVAA